MTTPPVPETGVDVNSATLPPRSYTSNGDRSPGRFPTGSVRSPSKFLVTVSGAVFPHGNSSPEVPLAAFSHSCSVGRRAFLHSQKAWASSHAIQTTGKEAAHSSKAEGELQCVR